MVMKKRKYIKINILAVHISSIIVNRVHKAFTAERREQLRQLSQMPDIYERLAHAVGKILTVRLPTIT